MRTAYRILLIAILIAGLVLPVMATEIRINATDARSILRGDVNEVFGTIQTGSGTDGITDYGSVGLKTSGTSNQYAELYRFPMIIDSSDLPDGCTINNVTLYLYLQDGDGTLAEPGFALTGFTSATPGEIAVSDYNKNNTVAYATDIPGSGFTYGAGYYYGIVFNADGRSAVNATGYTNLMGRTIWDRTNTPPSWSGSQLAYLAFGTTGEQIPYVIIDYTEEEEPPSYGNLTVHPVLSRNDTMILPHEDTNLPAEGYTLSINATPGQYTSSQFIIKPDVTSYGVKINITALSDGLGHTIPVSDIDIRTVKYWYQAGGYSAEPGYFDEPEPTFVPELLLKDDELVLVDEDTQQQQIYVINTTFEGYVHIDNTSIGQWHDDYQIYDTATEEGFPQPHYVEENENEEVWMTTHVPSDAVAGNYTGTVYVSSDYFDTVSLAFTVRVLPFSLVNATKDYGLYYRGIYTSSGTNNLSYIEKPPVNYIADMQDLLNHGVKYPMLKEEDPVITGDTYLALQARNDLDFPRDKVFMGFGVGSDDQGWVASVVSDVNDLIAANGISVAYIGGTDEPTVEQMIFERPALLTVITNGSKTYSSSNTYHLFTHLSDRLNVSIECNNNQGYNSTMRDQWHSVGAKIYDYGNPQVGNEYFEVYRKNYGFNLTLSGYDGVMDYAYQHGFGQTIWNDFDSELDEGLPVDYGGDYYYRDYAFAYPKTDGIIPTVAWEGMREAVYDSRYYDTLVAFTGTNTTAMSIVNAGISASKDSSEIRGTLIATILALGGGSPPVASFTKNQTDGTAPLPVGFTDTSTNTPTAWNWSYRNTTGNNTQIWFNQSQNPTYTLGAGNWSFALNASNAYGYNITPGNRWVNVSNMIIPVISFTKNHNVILNPQLLVVNDTSTGATSYDWNFGDGTSNMTTRNATHKFTRPGRFTITHIATNTGGSNVTTMTVLSAGRGYL